MQRELTSERRIFLSTELVGSREIGLALAAVSVSAVLFVAALPFASMPLGRIDAFIPSYESALTVCDLITAVLLFGQFVVLRSTAAFALACGYLFTALADFAHLLSFPGAFSETGLFGGNSQTTIWLYVFWHGGFPLFVMAYALLKSERRDPAVLNAMDRRPGTAIVIAIAVTLAVICGLAFLSTQLGGIFPALIHHNVYSPTYRIIMTGLCGFCAAAMATVWLKRARTVIDLWLMVVLSIWLFDMALSGLFNSGRFDLGWYGGKVYGLLAGSSLLIVFLAENIAHYIRIAHLSVALGTANKSLERMSQHDALTNLANRRQFDSYLASQMAVARRQKQSLALVLCDVDAFKAYNDLYGHPAGDDCLRQVAKALQNCCRRPADLAARYGGEEFALILPDTELAGAIRIAEYARQAVTRLRIPHAHSPAAPVVSISGGISILLWNDGATAETLIATTDRMLYEAKRRGRNRMVSADVENNRARIAAAAG